jgi:hypothetical protein
VVRRRERHDKDRSGGHRHCMFDDPDARTSSFETKTGFDNARDDAFIHWHAGSAVSPDWR